MRTFIYAILLALGISLFQGVAFAADRAPTAKCEHQDGYGKYSAEGATKNDARYAASTQCFNTQSELFYQSRGRYPTDDEAEPMLLACVNICR